MCCVSVRLLWVISWRNYGKVAEIVAYCNISKGYCYLMYHPLRRLRSTEFCPHVFFMGFVWLNKARFPCTGLTGVKLCFVVCRWGKHFEWVIYTHFRLQIVNVRVALMLPCELAEVNHEQSDYNLRTKFLTSKISCAVGVACLRNPKIGVSFQGIRIVLQNRQRPQRRGFPILRHVKKH